MVTGERWARALWDFYSVYPERTNRGWLQTLAIFRRTYHGMRKMVLAVQLCRAVATDVNHSDQPYETFYYCEAQV